LAGNNSLHASGDLESVSVHYNEHAACVWAFFHLFSVVSRSIAREYSPDSDGHSPEGELYAEVFLDGLENLRLVVGFPHDVVVRDDAPIVLAT
jgi:hypothetical protein